MEKEKDDANNEMNVGKNNGQDETTGPVYENNLDADTDVVDESLENRSSENEQKDEENMILKATNDSRDVKETVPTEENVSINAKENVEGTAETAETESHEYGVDDITHGRKETNEGTPDVLSIIGNKNIVAVDTGRSKKENMDLTFERPGDEDCFQPSTTSHENYQISNSETQVDDTQRETEGCIIQNRKRTGEDDGTINTDSSEISLSKLGPEIKYRGKSNQENLNDQETKNQGTGQTNSYCSKEEKEKTKRKGAHESNFQHVTNADKDDDESASSWQSCSLNEYHIVSQEEASGALCDDHAIKAMGTDMEKIRQERDQLQHVIDGLKQLIVEEEQYRERDTQVLKQSGLRSSPCEEIIELGDSKSLVKELRNILVGKNKTISKIGGNFTKQKRRFEGEKRTLREEADKKDLQIQTEIERSSNIQGSLDTVKKQLDEQKEANRELFEKQINLQMAYGELKTKANDYENKVQSLKRKIEDHEKRIKVYISDIQKKEKKIEVQENVVKAFQNDVKTKEMQINEQAKSLSKVLDDTQKLSNDKDLLSRKLQKQNEEIVVLREHVKVLEGTVKCQEEEKSKLNLRLSKLAGAHLTRDNPNIADLSDENRPTKIAEKFSELYDNEWTDAYEELCDKWELDERKSVDEMIKLLKVVERECSFYSRPYRDLLGDLQTVTVKLDKLSSKSKTTKNAAITSCENESRCQPKGDTLDEIERNHRDTKQTDPRKVYPKVIHKNIHEHTNAQELNEKNDILENTDEADIDSPDTEETKERVQNENELKDEAGGRMKNDETGESKAQEDNQTTSHKRKNGQATPIENMSDEDHEGKHSMKKQRCLTEIHPESNYKETDETDLERSNAFEQVGHQDTQLGTETLLVAGNGHTESRKAGHEDTNDNNEMGKDVGFSDNADDRNLDSNNSGLSSMTEVEAKEGDGRVEEEGQADANIETMSTFEGIEDKEHINLDKRENQTGNEIDRKTMATEIYKMKHSKEINDKSLDRIEDIDGAGNTIPSEKSIKHVEEEITVEEGNRTFDERHDFDDKGEEVEEKSGYEHRREHGYNKDNVGTEKDDVVAANDSTYIVENFSLPEKFSTCVDTGEVAAVLKIQVEFTAEQKKTLSDIKRLCTAKLEKSQKISEVIAQKVAFDMNHEYLQNPTVMTFIQKCAELCWFMVMQEPPVVVGFETETEDVKFDKDRYKAYTKTGKKLDFVVWPPLYLHKDGPMLCKGTAQGKD